MFALGAGISLYEGTRHVLYEQPVSHPLVNDVVLGLSFLFEGATWLVAFRSFKATKGAVGYYDAFRKSKDPPSFMVLFEDSAALIGILLAALGTFAATTLGAPVFDGSLRS